MINTPYSVLPMLSRLHANLKTGNGVVIRTPNYDNDFRNLSFASVNIAQIELLSTFSDSIPVSFHSSPSFICFERVLKRRQRQEKSFPTRDGECAANKSNLMPVLKQSQALEEEAVAGNANKQKNSQLWCRGGTRLLFQSTGLF